MLFMVVESFKDADPLPVYRRFRDRGRLAPDGVRYVNSWVSTDLATCYQVMDCDDAAALEQWLEKWSDLVDLEVVQVLTSPEAFELVCPRL